MYYVYILKSEKDGKMYTGFTRDLKQRIKLHNQGVTESTRYRRPLKLIYYEAYISDKDVRIRELFLKSGRGREVLGKQLAYTLTQ